MKLTELSNEQMITLAEIYANQVVTNASRRELENIVYDSMFEYIESLGPNQRIEYFKDCCDNQQLNEMLKQIK